MQGNTANGKHSVTVNIYLVAFVVLGDLTKLELDNVSYFEALPLK
jgi:hypothetical protein